MKRACGEIFPIENFFDDEEKDTHQDDDALIGAQTPALDSGDNRSAPLPEGVMDQQPQEPQVLSIDDLKTIEDPGLGINEQEQEVDPTVIFIASLFSPSEAPGLKINQEEEKKEQTDSSDVDSMESADETKLNLKLNPLPKDAISLVNEIDDLFINRKTIKRNHEGQLSAVMTINAKIYEGQGVSKNSAQEVACEKALRGFFIEKMKDQENSDSIMPQLASFAIHKLFKQWESDGFDCAALYTVDEHAPQSAVLPKKLKVRSTLPIDFKSMHPTLLLSYMRPNSVYKVLGSSGEHPNMLYTMGTKVDKQEFEATGTSKKKARLNVAVLACNTLFGTNLSPTR